LSGTAQAPDDSAMDKSETRKKQRPSLDLLGAFGFVVLITTIVYAVLTAS
jgi:hypothetical protein